MIGYATAKRRILDTTQTVILLFQAAHIMLRTLTLSVAVFVVSFTSGDAQAQMSSDTRGLQVTVRANQASWTVDDLNVNSDAGAGVTALLGYGVSRFVYVFGSYAQSQVDGTESEYALRHGDVGFRFTFLSPASRIRPYLGGGMTIRFANWQDPELGKVEVVSPGVSVGGGALLFLTSTIAVSVEGGMTVGHLTDVQVNDRPLDQDIGATVRRIEAGLSWFPRW